ncbi:MAG: acyl-CoA thioesterase [Muribaculaceae bacterium]|nr:acyl-CoA thioesterase [Muribaculaceae bacterium]
MNETNYIFTLEIAVRDYELDSEGIVNNAIYLHYLEMTRHEFCKWAGYSFKQMSDDGIIPVLSRVEIDYKTPLRSGDVMLSRLWVERNGVRFVFHQDIYNKVSGDMAVSAVVSVVSLEDGKLSRGEKLFEKYSKWL